LIVIKRNLSSQTENTEISYPEWLKREEKIGVKGIWEGMTFRKEYTFCILLTSGKMLIVYIFKN